MKKQELPKQRLDIPEVVVLELIIRDLEDSNRELRDVIKEIRNDSGRS